MSIITIIHDDNGPMTVTTLAQGLTGPQGLPGPQGLEGPAASNIIKSVNAKTGIVVLNAADVGADAAGSASNAEFGAANYTDNRISTEVTARTAAILVETNRATAAESAETLRATTAETAIALTVSTEITRATTAESALDSAIDSEVTRATDAEADLAADIVSGDAATLAAANTYADGLVVGLWDDRGNYDASVNTFPASGGSGTAGAILKGDIWTTSVVGTLGGVDVGLGDTIRALVDTPAQTASNWTVAENNLGYAPQPLNANLTAEAGLTGAADKVSYFTGLGTKALASLTAYGRSLIALVDRTGFLSLLSLTNADVGLGSVTNDAQVKRSEMGAASGVATLDSSSKINQQIDASKITSGILDISVIPAAAVERLVVVANQAARYALTIATVQNGDVVKDTDTGLMWYVYDQTQLGNSAGYQAFTASTASAVPWTGITSKPQTIVDVAAITGTDGDVIQRVAGSWVNRTMAQLFTALGFTTGTTAQYWRADKSLSTFATDAASAALAAVLTGLSTATNAVITATDSVLSALGKLQRQVSDNLTTLTNHTGNTSNPHTVTAAQVGLGNANNTSDANKPVSTAQAAADDLRLSMSDVFADFVASGGLFPTSANLTSTLPVTVAYAMGTRVALSATANTFTASKDTYVDVSNAGVLTYAAVANGAGEPALTANSVRLCKVVTSASAITSSTQANYLGAVKVQRLPASPNYTAIYAPGVTPTGSNYSIYFQQNGDTLGLNATSEMVFNASGGTRFYAGYNGVAISLGAPPSAKLHVGAGTAGGSAGQMKLNDSVRQTTKEAGTLIRVGNDWFFTGGDLVERVIARCPTQVDVTGSRTLNTTYTNPSSTRSMQVNATVRCVVTTASGSATAQGKSDTSTPPTTAASGIVGIQSGLLNEDNTMLVSFVVAAGAKYRIDSAVTNGTATLGSWFETSF